jgi:hypothetical protein
LTIKTIAEIARDLRIRHAYGGDKRYSNYLYIGLNGRPN